MRKVVHHLHIANVHYKEYSLDFMMNVNVFRMIRGNKNPKKYLNAPANR